MLHPEHIGLLSARERRTLGALARTAIPPGEHIPGAGASAVAQVEGYLATFGGAAARGYRAGLWALDAAAHLAHGRAFSDLALVEAEALLAGWQQGDYLRRTALRAIVTPIKVAHYGSEAFYRHVGCRFEKPVAEARPRWMQERIVSAVDVAGETLECDVVVVGTGAGGAVVGKELAERGLAVVLVEEGEYFGRADFAGSVFDRQQKLYRHLGADFTVGNVSIPIPTGKTVGGTTTINSGTCYRTPERVLAHWRADHGLADFSSETMAPYYEKVEAVLGVAPAQEAYLGGVARVIGRGCDELGWKHGPLRRNAPDCDGQGTCCFGCPTDAKRSTNVSYVPLALRAGATLVKGARVSRVLVEGGRAVGVEARAGRRGAPLRVRGRAVVVACGALETPLLLERSGVGAASGQLGRNLSIHPATGAMALFDETIEGYRGIPQGYGIEEFHDEGILFEGAFGPPDMGAASLSLIGRPFVEAMESYDRLACFGFLIEDTSRGRVRRMPRGTGPLITYVLNDNDVARLKRGIELLVRVYLVAGARRVMPFVRGHEVIESEADFARLRAARLGARDFELSAYHPLGTARMGASPARSVVSADHEVHDAPGLYVVDGSVMPSSLAVNPQLTIMAMATRAADRLAQRLA